ncbi:hypothetical protein N752_20755 [Desulforamulus aquiferis]|nr:hypothetical protein N752_20755 [Desulforamulus aquiferis]
MSEYDENWFRLSGKGLKKESFLVLLPAKLPGSLRSPQRL